MAIEGWSRAASFEKSCERRPRDIREGEVYRKRVRSTASHSYNPRGRRIKVLLYYDKPIGKIAGGVGGLRAAGVGAVGVAGAAGVAGVAGAAGVAGVAGLVGVVGVVGVGIVKRLSVMYC